MFRTGLKHEFRAVARIVMPMLIVLLIGSMLMSLGFMLDGFVLDKMIKEDGSGEVSLPQVLVAFLEAILGFGIVILLCAISIAVFVMMVRRFYVSFFTDEGYLTFTLPMSMDCHLMIKIVSMLIWNVLSGIAAILALLIIAGGAEIAYGGVITEAFSILGPELAYMFELLGESMQFPIMTLVLTVISTLLSYVFEVLLLYFAIALGCMLVKRHRLIASIVCIICINSVSSFIGSIVSTFLTLASMSFEIVYLILLIISVLLTVVEIIAFYIFTKYILEKKLNLD